MNGNGEKYSKKAYMNAEREESAEDVKFFESQTERDNNPNINEILIENSIRARERVEELYGKGQAEAKELNEEYDRLLANAQEAIKALEDFKKNKLGMSR